MAPHLRIIFFGLAVLGLAACGDAPSADRRNPTVQANVEAYQRALIARGVTGGSVAGVFMGPDTVAFSIVNSGLAGDTPISANTIFPIWSMTKPITVVAMMMLHERGLFALDDPVAKILPYFADMKCKDETGSVYRCENELRIVHLLTHRSGYGYYPPGRGPSHLAPYASLDEFVRVLAATPAEFEPGSDYLYGNSISILGRLVEVLSGMEFYVFLKENIFDPLDMPDTKFELSAADRGRFQVLFKKPDQLVGSTDIITSFDVGTATFTTEYDELSYVPGTKVQLGGDGLVSTFEDYRHFCEMLLGKGSYQGKRILSEQSIAMMTSVATQGRLVRGYSAGIDYGYSLYVLTEPVLSSGLAPKGIYGWVGYHNTDFWIDNETGLYGLFMTRTSPYSAEIGKQFRSAVYRGLD